MRKVLAFAAVCALLCLGSLAQATTIVTVPVGNPGNAGEISGSGTDPGHTTHGPGFGPERVCGAVSYGYKIGKYEVTASQYAAFLNAVAKTDTYGLYETRMVNTSGSSYGCGIARSGSSGSYSYTVASGFESRPVNYVSWGDAARFANWLHNGQPVGPQSLSTTEDGAYYLNGATTNTQLQAVTRKSGWRWAIPSEDEWYKAAYHKNDGVTGNYWDYPTQTDSAPGRDMSEATNPGNNANYWNGSGAYPIDSGKYTTVSAEFERSLGPYGTFDMGGNVWEWDEAIIATTHRGLRGGSFYNGDVGSMRASERFYDYYATDQGGNVGFRVVMAPEPSSLIALAGGLAFLLGRRRRRA